MKLPRVLTDYIFLPSGEAVRAVELTVSTAVVNTLYKDDWTQLGNWKAYAVGACVAAIIATLAAIKDLLPSNTPSTLRKLFRRQ